MLKVRKFEFWIKKFSLELIIEGSSLLHLCIFPRQGSIYRQNGVHISWDISDLESTYISAKKHWEASISKGSFNNYVTLNWPIFQYLPTMCNDFSQCAYYRCYVTLRILLIIEIPFYEKQSFSNIYTCKGNLPLIFL